MYKNLTATLLSLLVLTQAFGGQPDTDTSFPVTLKQYLGDVTISEAPIRIVALGQSDIDVLAALEITPVAALADAYSETAIAPWLEGQISPDETGIAPASQEISVEWITAQNPDLILATGLWNADQIL